MPFSRMVPQSRAGIRRMFPLRTKAQANRPLFYSRMSSNPRLCLVCVFIPFRDHSERAQKQLRKSSHSTSIRTKALTSFGHRKIYKAFRSWTNMSQSEEYLLRLDGIAENGHRKEIVIRARGPPIPRIGDRLFLNVDTDIELNEEESELDLELPFHVTSVFYDIRITSGLLRYERGPYHDGEFDFIEVFASQDDRR